MTKTVGTDEQRASDASAVSAQSRPRWVPGGGWIVAILVGLMALGLALAYFLWWTKPTTFTDVGNALGMNQTTETMRPITVDMVQRSIHADAETITLNGVSPRVVTNTADALITFAVCQREGTPFMSASGDAERSCETVTSVEGKQVSLTADATTTIVMTVAPQSAGRVVINGMEVDYSRGSDHLWQHGSQATGPVVKVTVGK